MKTHICEECGSEYYRDNYIINTRFCSKDCRRKNQHKNKVFTVLNRNRLKEATTKKVCSVCHIEQPICNFSIGSANKDGYSPRCKQCAVNMNLNLRTQKSNYLKSFKSTPKKNKISAKRYHDSVIIKCHSNRENAHENHDIITYEDWVTILKNQKNRCAVCGLEFTLKNPPTRDHIISISWGGTLSKNNVQALCGHCNSKKGTRCYTGLGYKLIHTNAEARE